MTRLQGPFDNLFRFLGQKIDILVSYISVESVGFKPMGPSMTPHELRRCVMGDCLPLQAAVGGRSDRPESCGELWSIRHAAEPACGSHVAPLRPARHAYP